MPGIGQEALGGEIGLPTVAECNAVAGDEDLAFDANRYQPEPFIEHVQARVANRCADDNALRISRHLGEAGPYGGLGRAVDVPQALAARFERFGQRQRQRFAATQNVQAGRAPPVGIDQHLPGCRRSLHQRCAAKPDLGCQSPTVRRGLLVDDMQPGADTEWQQQFEHRDIERDRRYGRKHVVRVDRCQPLEGGQQVDHGPMADFNTLRQPGGSGRVHDIGKIGLRDRNRGIRCIRRLECVQIQIHHVRFRRCKRVSHYVAHTRVLEHMALTRCGKVGVERRISRPGFQNAQQGNRQSRCSGNRQSNDVAADNTAFVETCCNPLTALTKLAIRQYVLGIRYRNSFRMRIARVLDQHRYRSAQARRRVATLTDHVADFVI